MHLVESFALDSGLKIDKPFIYESFYPLPFDDKYITIQPYGKYPCRHYDYWQETIDILIPHLKNTKIIQLGTKDEVSLNGALDLRAQTSLNQMAYLIKRSALHLGIDSLGIHYASGFQRKIVGLYCNMLPSQSGPYWSDQKDCIILEPPRKKNELPSYFAVEKPKTINKIKPEDIAKAVCKLLNIPFEFQYKSLFVGEKYHLKKIELVPQNSLGNWKELGIDSIIVRMDKHFNERVLNRQLQLCPCSIVTDRAIDSGILKMFKDKIPEFVYLLKKDSDPNDVLKARACGVPVFLISFLPEEELNKIKLKFADCGDIIREQQPNKKAEEAIKKKNIFYKNSTLTVADDKLWSCWGKKAKHEINQVNNYPLQPFVDDEELTGHLEDLILYEKKG